MEHELDEVVATPTRLSKLLREMDTLSLRAVCHLRWIRLFDMGVALLLPHQGLLAGATRSRRGRHSSSLR